MIHFLFGCWLGCFGGFMLAGLLRKASDSTSQDAEGSAPSLRDAYRRETPPAMSEPTAP
jgi:hypothetical protein